MGSRLKCATTRDRGLKSWFFILVCITLTLLQQSLLQIPSQCFAGWPGCLPALTFMTQHRSFYMVILFSGLVLTYSSNASSLLQGTYLVQWVLRSSFALFSVCNRFQRMLTAGSLLHGNSSEILARGSLTTEHWNKNARHRVSCVTKTNVILRIYTSVANKTFSIEKQLPQNEMSWQ